MLFHLNSASPDDAPLSERNLRFKEIGSTVNGHIDLSDIAD